MSTARERALEKKAILEEERRAQREAAEERERALDWQKGAKNNSKQVAKENAEMEKLKKKQEMEALLAADEVSVGNIKSASKQRKKGKDSFDLLNAALSAQPKTKAQKEKEKKEKELELKKKKQEEIEEVKLAKLERERKQQERNAARGIVKNQAEELMENKVDNTVEIDDESAFLDGHGLDGALSVLTFNGTGSPKPPEGVGNKKALYKAFCERNLAQLKEEFPNLKYSQYNERLFALWQKSSENPANFINSDGTVGTYSSASTASAAATALGIARAASRGSGTPVPVAK